MDERLLGVELERHRRAVAPGALDRLGRDEVEPDVLALGRLLFLARELHELGDESAHLLELLDHVAEEALSFVGCHRLVARENLDVRAEAGERSAQLVRGVGDELALRAGRLLEGREHRVEARREAVQLVAAADVDAAREISGLRHLLGRGRQPADRCQGGARDHEPERTRQADAGEGDQDEQRPRARERVVHLGERPRDLDRVAVPGRLGEHPHVHASDLGVREEASLVARCDGQRAIAGGEREIGALGADRRSVGGDDLDVAARLAERGSGDPQEELARPGLDRLHRNLGDHLDAAAERVVDLGAKLVPHDGVRDHGGERHCDGDRERGRDGQAGAEAHCSRSA